MANVHNLLLVDANALDKMTLVVLVQKILCFFHSMANSSSALFEYRIFNSNKNPPPLRYKTKSFLSIDKLDSFASRLDDFLATDTIENPSNTTGPDGILLNISQAIVDYPWISISIDTARNHLIIVSNNLHTCETSILEPQSVVSELGSRFIDLFWVTAYGTRKSSICDLLSGTVLYTEYFLNDLYYRFPYFPTIHTEAELPNPIYIEFMGTTVEALGLSLYASATSNVQDLVCLGLVPTMQIFDKLSNNIHILHNYKADPTFDCIVDTVNGLSTHQVVCMDRMSNPRSYSVLFRFMDKIIGLRILEHPIDAWIDIQDKHLTKPTEFSILPTAIPTVSCELEPPVAEIQILEQQLELSKTRPVPCSKDEDNLLKHMTNFLAFFQQELYGSSLDRVSETFVKVLLENEPGPELVSSAVLETWGSKEKNGLMEEAVKDWMERTRGSMEDLKHREIQMRLISLLKFSKHQTGETKQATVELIEDLVQQLTLYFAINPDGLTVYSQVLSRFVAQCPSHLEHLENLLLLEDYPNTRPLRPPRKIQKRLFQPPRSPHQANMSYSVTKHRTLGHSSWNSPRREIEIKWEVVKECSRATGPFVPETPVKPGQKSRSSTESDEDVVVAETPKKMLCRSRT